LLDALFGHGLTAAPRDALPEVRRRVHHLCRVRGGSGALRDFAEWLLALRA
jgi:3-deoxy-D-manno-octulosonate 8-phosphate phosphatase (KDO 8-P phosphatase)